VANTRSAVSKTAAPDEPSLNQRFLTIHALTRAKALWKEIAGQTQLDAVGNGYLSPSRDQLTVAIFQALALRKAMNGGRERAAPPTPPKAA
jgi:hypothetical protein